MLLDTNDLLEIEYTESKYSQTKKKRGPKPKTIRSSSNIHQDSKLLLNLREISPMTLNQKRVFESYSYGNHIIMHGSPGTGKTFLALYLALRDVLNGDYRKVVVIRSAQPTKSVGFLPGTLQEKTEVYELPYINICQELFNSKLAYDNLKKSNKIEFMSSSYMRGLTLSDSIVILDEAQSATLHEISTIVTRLGENSKLMVLGDMAQNDLLYTKEKSGYADAIKIFQTMSDVEVINFTWTDIVRSKFIKDFIIAKETLGL